MKGFWTGDESLRRIGSAKELLETEKAHLRCPCHPQYCFRCNRQLSNFILAALTKHFPSQPQPHTQMILMSLTARSRPRTRFLGQLWCKFVLTVLHVFRVSQDALNKTSYRLLVEVGFSSLCVSGHGQVMLCSKRDYPELGNLHYMPCATSYPQCAARISHQRFDEEVPTLKWRMLGNNCSIKNK